VVIARHLIREALELEHLAVYILTESQATYKDGAIKTAQAPASKA
jgi:hypothetical protein